MKGILAYGAAIAVLLVSACGDGAKTVPSGDPASRASSRAMPKAAASAAEVAREARGDLDCPAVVKTPAPAPGMPATDVVGVRVGMTYDEARNVVLCTHDLLVADDAAHGFTLNTHGVTIRQGFGARFAKDRIVKSSRDYMREMGDEFAARSGNAVRHDVLPGETKWYVGTMGVPGEERVIMAAREEWFAEGRQPTMESVAAALAKKYGAPIRTNTSGNPVQFAWVYDPRMQAAPEGSPLHARCFGVADPDGGVNLTPECGVVVTAHVHALPENPGLVRYLQVGVVDQARGYAAVGDTEARLAAYEQQRRANQVEQAAKNADAPKL